MGIIHQKTHAEIAQALTRKKRLVFQVMKGARNMILSVSAAYRNKLLVNRLKTKNAEKRFGKRHRTRIKESR